MARPHKLWFRSARNSWYVEIDGKQHKLGPDYEEAQRQMHALLAKAPTDVAFCYRTKAPGSARWCRDYCQDLIDYLISRGKCPATMDPHTVVPAKLRRWISKRGRGERTRIKTVKAAFAWGHSEGWIKTNPLAGMKRPGGKPREDNVTLEEFEAMLRAIPDCPFRRLLVFCWETGCRAQEAKALERRHLYLDAHLAIFPKEETKTNRKARPIALTPKAERIIRQQLQSHDQPFIFVNSRRKRWTANAVRCRFKRLEETLGKRYCQTLFRHGYATAMAMTTDIHTLAKLMGHEGTRMLDRHYSHLGEQHAFLVEAACRPRGVAKKPTLETGDS